MPGTFELNRERSSQRDGELEADQRVLLDDEIAYNYINEGPVSPEQLRAVIAQRAVNLSVVRRAGHYTHPN